MRLGLLRISSLHFTRRVCGICIVSGTPLPAVALESHFARRSSIDLTTLISGSSSSSCTHNSNYDSLCRQLCIILCIVMMYIIFCTIKVKVTGYGCVSTQATSASILVEVGSNYTHPLAILHLIWRHGSVSILGTTRTGTRAPMLMYWAGLSRIASPRERRPKLDRG